MKHWNPSDAVAGASRLSRAERKRLDAILKSQPITRGRTRPDLSSMVGLTLAIVFLAGLVWAVTPTDPVSAEVR
jgi:hypothetical protein